MRSRRVESVTARAEGKSSYWAGKNVFITGVNGFIGGNLARSLLDQGACVVGLMRNARRDTLLFYEGLNEAITLVDGDVTDKELIARVVSEERIHAVFHLAAQVEVGVGLANPHLTFETNIRGTYCLLEAIRLCPHTVESVIIASSDKAYGSYPREKMPYREDYPLRPKYPYDTSKACADMVARCYATEIYRLPVVVTRFSNIYGPGQLNFSALIPDAIRACLGYGTFVPRGNGRQVRDFIFVEDVVELYLRIAQALAGHPERYRGQVYNAGTNKPRSVRRVLQSVYRLTGRTREFRSVLEMMKGRETVGEIDCQYMDFRKVGRDFGWAPRHSLDKGLTRTIEWFRGYLKYQHAPRNHRHRSLPQRTRNH